MLFNFGKCKCLHTEPGNTGMNYEMGGIIISKTAKEKYLGVSMNANMKVSEQHRIAASKGNQVLGMIRRNITYKEKSLIVPLYEAIVRPHSSSFLSFHQESCPLNCALPMPGTADGDVVSRCQVFGRAGSVHHGADQ